MVKIANPIYDTIFKRLMENKEVARGLISTLLNVEILEFQLRRAFVQIPRIRELTGQSEVEMALRMFNQAYARENKHFLALTDELIRTGPEWLRQAFRVLQSAASDEETQKQMAVEDELTDMLDHMEQKHQETQRQLEEERRLKEAALAQAGAALTQVEEERPWSGNWPNYAAKIHLANARGAARRVGQ